MHEDEDTMGSIYNDKLDGGRTRMGNQYESDADEDQDATEGDTPSGIPAITPELITRIARDFSNRISVEIGADRLERAYLLNRSRGGSGCASHDFCDANMLMLEAFEAVGFVDVVDRISEESNADQEGPGTITHTWNAAWDEAKAAGFYVPEAADAAISAAYVAIAQYFPRPSGDMSPLDYARFRDAITPHMLRWMDSNRAR